ncbi:hypothetical protein [Massilia genomosp. 1]|uniref:DUF4410 domain-containing protein n=1 Tax=Massilia genomosp. 1 TaxID=2609280 RepID=A0ABX0MP43_9BURK|nr:hypothetical protein [Massilia genomosp. 1]NHZ61144.1 hypothetical protein [Massilia genomosp. 1]
MKKPSIHLFAPLLSCLLAVSAGAAETKVALNYEAASSDVVAKPVAGACAINIVSISDQRPTKDGIGADFPVPTDSPEPFVSASLDALKEYGFTVSHSKTAVPQAVNLDVRLIRAYTLFGHMRINAMVALDVTAQGAAQEKFRATGSKANMWGAQSEHVTALNYATNTMLASMAPALAAHCGKAGIAAR